jgi:hypothetical protein
MESAREMERLDRFDGFFGFCGGIWLANADRRLPAFTNFSRRHCRWHRYDSVCEASM